MTTINPFRASPRPTTEDARAENKAPVANAGQPVSNQAPRNEISISATARQWATATAAPAEDSWDLKRLKNMQEGLQRLTAMPTASQVQKQAAANKAGWLKQRLEALKMLLLHASPEQAKAMAQELKSIAKELGTLGGNLGTAAQSSSNGTDASASQAAGQAAQAEAVAATASGDAQTETTQTASGEATPLGTQGSEKGQAMTTPENSTSAPSTGGNDQLRAALNDAKKLLKEVIGLFKSKRDPHDKESTKALEAAEKSLRDLDEVVGQQASDSVDQGNIVETGPGPATDVPTSGTNIDIKV